MTMVSFGDLAQSFLLKSQMARLKADSGRITQELASGRVSDVGAAVSGDFSLLSGLARSHNLAKGYLGAAQEAAFHTGAVQTIVAHVAENTQALVSPLLLASQAGSPDQIDLAVTEARTRLDGVLAGLNTSLAGRTLLAGVTADGAAVRDTDTILSALRGQITGALTAEEAMARISDWFDDPAGFTALAYQGGADLADLAVSATEKVGLGPTANDAAFRSALKGLTAAALMNDPALGLPASAVQDFAQLAARQLIAGQDDLTQLAAQIGMTEGRIEAVQSRHSAEVLSFELAQAELLQGDPYRLATELEAVQTNLETVYAVTARLSRLSLTDFL